MNTILGMNLSVSKYCHNYSGSKYMLYGKTALLEAESNLIDYSNSSVAGGSIVKKWKVECKTLYGKPKTKSEGYLKYADARKLLICMLQNSFIFFETEELEQTCNLILQLLKFSDCNGKYLLTNRQKDAWFINELLKKYNFSFWEVFLRDIGEDETDVVRKIYDYLDEWENRMNAADTLLEYLYKKDITTYEAEQIKSCIQSLEADVN